VVYQRVDPGGTLRGSLLVTGIQLRIRGDGVVERAHLADSSGVTPLDDEAMAAIKRMKLPPLPPEILDDKGGFDVKCSMNFDLARSVSPGRSTRPSPTSGGRRRPIGPPIPSSAPPWSS
jgi:TonB family protein